MMVSVRQSVPPAPLISEDDIRNELHRLFDGGVDSGLVIRVYGEQAGAATDTFREMLASLQMYAGKARGEPLEILVDAPEREPIAKALSVLGHEAHQKKFLDHVLRTFGRRLIDPLTDILDTTPTGSVMARLTLLRDIFLAQVAELRMTPESQQILSGDLRKLLTDDYLALVAENEERVQRPRVAKLAQQILRLVGSTFHQALKRWPSHAGSIATDIARRNAGQVRLREIPVLIREQVTGAIEEYLWLETSGVIEEALAKMLADHPGGVEALVPKQLERSTYREFADACWNIIADHC